MNQKEPVILVAIIILTVSVLIGSGIYYLKRSMPTQPFQTNYITSDNTKLEHQVTSPNYPSVSESSFDVNIKFPNVGWIQIIPSTSQTANLATITYFSNDTKSRIESIPPLNGKYYQAIQPLNDHQSLQTKLWNELDQHGWQSSDISLNTNYTIFSLNAGGTCGSDGSYHQLLIDKFRLVALEWYINPCTDDNGGIHYKAGHRGTIYTLFVSDIVNTNTISSYINTHP